MNNRESRTTEQAVLAVLTGASLSETAARVPTLPETLSEAIEVYRAAGRGALEARSDPLGWYQVHIEFTDYNAAEQTVVSHLLPVLQQAEHDGAITGWWFIRKSPCWRFRFRPASRSANADMRERIDRTLDAMVSCGATRRWWPSPYEPETFAFGGPEGISIAHDLFHADSRGILNYLHQQRPTGSGALGRKETSLLLISVLLRAAGQEWGEQGDIWAQVTAKRPLPADEPLGRVQAMVPALRQLMTVDAGPGSLYMTTGPLAPLADWSTSLEETGRRLGGAGRKNRLTLGTRSILARHITFHWNRLAFTPHQQAIWAEAAREAIIGR